MFFPFGLNETTMVPIDFNGLDTIVHGPIRLGVVTALHAEGPLDFTTIAKPKTSVAEIWLYSAAAADQSRWFLYGNLLDRPQGFEVPWPVTYTRGAAAATRHRPSHN